MATLDPTFTNIKLHDLADAALSEAKKLGCAHADLRIERVKRGERQLHDAVPESVTNTTDMGISIRVVHHGAWGFASSGLLTTEEAVRLAHQAVELAKISAPLCPNGIELADEPVHNGTWVSSYDVNPFDVDETEKLERLADLSRRLMSADAVSHVVATVNFAQENTFFANLSGTATTQQRVYLHPNLEAINVSDTGFATMNTLAPPVGRGWEYLHGEGWDFDDEIARIPELLAEHVAAPSIEAGRYDLVVDPTQLWLTVHESIAHGTELDRALGYEAAYAGSSFATFDQLGTLKYGSSHLNVTGDRNIEHGLATIGWDQEGVEPQAFDIVSEGTLVGFQLNRQMAAENGFERSNGCAFADSASHIPMQRMPNVSIKPAPDGPDTEELIARVDDGLYLMGDKSWSIDMQRYNFQFTAQRFYRIKNGKIVGQVKDAAYQATTTDFWGSLEAAGGPQTWLLAGATNCGKGQPGQTAPVSHGVPACLFRDVNVLNTAKES